MDQEQMARDSEETRADEPIPSLPVKKKRSKAVIILSILLVLVAAAGTGAYWWRDDQSNKQHDTDTAKISQLQSQVDKKVAVETPKPTTTEPTDAAKENIIASITSDNTAALEGYMADSVHVVIAASEAAFVRTPAGAITDLNYVSDAVDPWNFALDDATLADYAKGDYKTYFKSDSIVGVSADKKVVVFNFDDAGKINGVFMAVSSDIL